MYVLVNSAIYSSIKDRVVRYANDVQSDLGIEVRVNSLSSSTSSTDIRTMLQEAGSDLRGCLFIGDVASAWCKFTSPSTNEYPTDEFYMDLNGIWTDSNKDRKYDAYQTSGTLFEIWVSRLNGSIDQIKDYFDRNHAYRIGNLIYPKRALVYTDDDWIGYSLDPERMIGEIYSNLTLIYDRATTCKDDYLRRLAEGWSIVSICSHGSSSGHSFKIPDSATGVSVWESEGISTTDYELKHPKVLFYNLCPCTGARFTDSPCLGFSCIHSGALAVTGQTRTGIGMTTGAAMHFYSLLSQGRTFGEAFRESYNMYAQEITGWVYTATGGEILLGDPTLRIPKWKMYPPAEFTCSPRNARVNEAVTFNASSSSDPNATIVNYTWDFGDGNITTISKPLMSHAYSSSGNYTVTLNVTDSFAQSNTTSAQVIVIFPTDINMDNTVNIIDITIVAAAYNTRPGDEKWNEIADLDKNRLVNILDISMVARDFGKTV